MIPEEIASLYGHPPQSIPELSVHTLERSTRADGSVRAQIRIELSHEGRRTSFVLLLLIPPGSGPHPVILSANLNGNHSVTTDTYVYPSNPPQGWAWRMGMPRFVAERGTFAHRFPAEFLVAQGYAAATFFYDEAEPDMSNQHRGVRALFGGEYQWGTLSAWAWCYSRAIDALVHEPSVDGTRITLYGFSRAGKSALLAAAQDMRAQAVIAESSGKGGAALWKHHSGERAYSLVRVYPYWFSATGRRALKNVHTLVHDQDALLGALAPRPALIVVGANDWWSDPEGQREAVRKAKRAYGASEPLLRFVVRAGGHEPRPEDWKGYLRVLRHLGGIMPQ